MLGELPIPQQINTLTTKKVLSTLGQSFQTNPGRCRSSSPPPPPACTCLRRTDTSISVPSARGHINPTAPQEHRHIFKMPLLFFILLLNSLTQGKGLSGDSCMACLGLGCWGRGLSRLSSRRKDRGPHLREEEHDRIVRDLGPCRDEWGGRVLGFQVGEVDS